MKHLLIILSTLLLSSPVIGDNHKGETLYLWETSSGEVWKGFGDKETQPVYNGDVKNGKPNGLGVMIFPDGDKYVGEWKNGKRNGHGTFIHSGGVKSVRGEKYVGEWKNGKKHGQGTETYFGGRKYVGEWKNGLEHGQGIYTYRHGPKYIGEWRESYRWNGIHFDENGNIYYKYVNGIRTRQ